MWKDELARKLDAADFGEKTAIIGEYEKMTGKSRSALWRTVRENGYGKTRQQRSDCGKCCLTDDQILWIAAQIHVAKREIKGTITPVAKALMDAEDNGILPPGAVSVPRLTAILREKGIGKKAQNAPEPHTNMKSLHPNHVHLFDCSVCIQFYLKGKFRMMREDSFYKNKWENFAKIKRKLIRYVIVDHYSGAFFVKYYYTPGESQENLFDFLRCAWAGDKHSKFPFRGVPFYMLMDAGSANTSGAIRNFLGHMDVKMPKSRPPNPRRQGAVEVVHNIIECWFESSLRIQPATSEEELNRWALDFAVWFNAAKLHSRHRMKRTECWLRIKPDQLRELPPLEILQELYANPEEDRRVNSDYSISYRSNIYVLKDVDGIMPGLSVVKVIMRPYTFPDISVRFKDNEYIVSPIRTDDAGFREDAAVIGEEYRAVPESVTQKAVKLMDGLAWGGRSKEEAPFEGAVVLGNKADKVSVEFLPKKGVDHKVVAMQADIMGKEISMMEFFKRLLAATGSIKPELNSAIRRQYGNAMTLGDANILIQAAKDGRLEQLVYGQELPDGLLRMARAV